MRTGLVDSPDRYGRISRALHWGMAALFGLQLLAVTAHALLDRENAVRQIVWKFHSPLGVTLAVLVVLRVFWALANRRRRPRTRGRIGRIARAGHLVLYALMVTIPAIAILRAYGGGRGLVLGDLRLLPASGIERRWMMAPADLLHGYLGWALFALIGGHIAMTLVHQAIWRDGTLARMIGPRRRGRA